MPSGVERALSEEPSANARERAWCDGSGVRCAGACSGEVPVLEAAARVFSLRPMAPAAAAVFFEFHFFFSSPLSQRISDTLLLRRPLLDLR